MTNKQKSTEVTHSSSKKTKNDVASKKEDKFTCDMCSHKTHSKTLLQNHKEASCESKLD